MEMTIVSKEDVRLHQFDILLDINLVGFIRQGKCL